MKSIELKYKYLKYSTRLLFLFVLLNLNLLDVKTSGLHNKNQILEEDFSSVYMRHSSMFEENDIYSHLREFFGLNSELEIFKGNYTDLTITNDSKNLRELYDAKLNQMTKKGSNGREKIELFFKDKL